MKIAYFGTPEFAAIILKTLHGEKNFDIVQVITQPDKNNGRNKRLTAPPVKILAEELDLPVKQPKNKAELKEIVENLDVDFFVVVAYGMILKKDILNIPKVAAINVHASLLPMYRGASPIHEALLNGDRETGVSIMKMDEGLDTGNVYLLRRQTISRDDNLESLRLKLAGLSANLLPIALRDIYDGELTPIPQNDKKASYCHKIKKSDGKIDWRKSAEEINNMIRAYNPWPSVHTEHNGKKIKILKAKTLEENNEPGKFQSEGKILKIGTGKGTLIPEILQPEGKKAMDSLAFINGYLKR